MYVYSTMSFRLITEMVFTGGTMIPQNGLFEP